MDTLPRRPNQGGSALLAGLGQTGARAVCRLGPPDPFGFVFCVPPVTLERLAGAGA